MLKKLIIVITLVALSCIGVFVVLDQQVGAGLAKHDFSKIPGYYSDVLEIRSGRMIPAAIFREQLLRRRYREVTEKPEKAGDFSHSGDLFVFVTRQAKLPNGLQAPSLAASFNTATGKLETSNGQERVYLEPQLIAYLTSGDLRADSYTPLKKIPPAMRNAIIAAEDERFFAHFGVDVIGVARAMLTNLKAMRLKQGGSTLTQQLAKNLLLSPERSLKRKLSEFFMAISLERRLSKNEILELYLNEVYLGQEGSVAIHGVSEAAQFFFGKKVEDLSISDAALLAGIIRAPSSHSPRRFPKRARQRRDTVLKQMREQNYITGAQFITASAAPINLTRDALQRREAAHYTVALREELANYFNVDAALRSGLRVYTGIDLDMQQCAERAVAEGLAELEKQNPALKRRQPRLEAGLVAIEPYSGKIRAWVGGRDYSLNQFDHVYQAKRQMGSTIKPFLYLSALDRNLNSYKVASPLSVLSDAPFELKLADGTLWQPEDYDRKYRGDVTLRYALEHSLNIPAVHVGLKVGPDVVARTGVAFGLAEHLPAVPSLALGASETTLLRLTSAFSALANGGIKVTPRLFISAEDGSETQLATAPIEEKQIADENAVFVLTNILQGVIERGTGAVVRRSGFKRAAAGKTGSSSDTRDAWFAGFTPTLTAGVWVGYDDNKTIGLTGAKAAAPIWAKFMQCAEPFYEDASFIPPRGVTWATVDTQSGLLADRSCEGTAVREIFVQGTEPRMSCSQSAPIQDEFSRREEYPQGPAGLRKRESGFWDYIWGR